MEPLIFTCQLSTEFYPLFQLLEKSFRNWCYLRSQSLVQSQSLQYHQKYLNTFVLDTLFQVVLLQNAILLLSILHLLGHEPLALAIFLSIYSTPCLLYCTSEGTLFNATNRFSKQLQRAEKVQSVCTEQVR